MTFRKYDHVERLGHDEVEGLTLGNRIYVFAKLDGTNASVWFEPGGDEDGPHICCGSRTRTLSAEQDNAGFFAWAHDSAENEKRLWEVYRDHHNWILYGEWLVPHTFRQYREEAWRKFYIFDVYDNAKGEYLHYDDYAPVCLPLGLDIIEPMCVYKNPSDDQLQKEVENNSYLILDGGGAGEGIVMKNYDWRNRYGRQPWAKIVRNEFKEENRREFGVTEKGGAFQVECAMVEEFLTQSLVRKTRSKILFELYEKDIEAEVEVRPDPNAYEKGVKRVQERHRGQIIPQLLGTVFYEFVNEELWTALKKHKFPVVDFKKLRTHSVLQTKKHAPDLF